MSDWRQDLIDSMTPKKRGYKGKFCIEPECDNSDLHIPFWGDYCTPCASFHRNKIPNGSQAYLNSIKKT